MVRQGFFTDVCFFTEVFFFTNIFSVVVSPETLRDGEIGSEICLLKEMNVALEFCYFCVISGRLPVLLWNIPS